ncbi:MAG TPA: type II secretion system protein [Candidatus Woesebacteria bacterium]|nr:type II secretion system protein [Candidatus Woesebacteria bacterium]HPJ17136.1 type II secretion system protein [Candidatus Woesebacteria bacterium]
MKGFTLIETMVVVALMGVLLTATSLMMINTLKAKNRTVVMENVEQNSSEIARQIKNLLLAAEVNSILCPVGQGSSITFINSSDQGITSIVCNNDRISSQSGILKINNWLTNEAVKVSNCERFISCSTMPSVDGDKVSSVEFTYYLDSGSTLAGVENYSKKLFNFSVGIRN